MRSLHLRGAAGQAKLRGKRCKSLSCGCCVVQDLRPIAFEQLVRQELQSVDQRGRPLPDRERIV